MIEYERKRRCAILIILFLKEDGKEGSEGKRDERRRES